MRYRRPSLKSALGITRAKKRINRVTGITALKKPLRAPGNAGRTIKRRAGYYREPFKFGRFLKRLFRRS